MVRCRFSQIIDARPQKLSHGPGKIPVHSDAVLQTPCPPAGCGISERRTLPVFIRQDPGGKREMIDSPALDHGRCLAPVDHPVGMFFMMLLIVVLSVIIACDLQDIGTSLPALPGHPVRRDGHSGVFCRIPPPHLIPQMSGQIRPSLWVCMGIINLVPDTPEDH